MTENSRFMAGISTLSVTAIAIVQEISIIRGVMIVVSVGLVSVTCYTFFQLTVVINPRYVVGLICR